LSHEKNIKRIEVKSPEKIKNPIVRRRTLRKGLPRNYLGDSGDGLIGGEDGPRFCRMGTLLTLEKRRQRGPWRETQEEEKHRHVIVERREEPC